MQVPTPRDIETQLLPERMRQVRRLEEKHRDRLPRVFHASLPVKIERKAAPGAPLPQLTSASESMSATSSSGKQHQELTVTPLPEPASAGAYDNLPEPVSSDDSGNDMREGDFMIHQTPTLMEED